MKIVSLSDFNILLFHTYIDLKRHLLRQTNFLTISTIFALFVIDWHGMLTQSVRFLSESRSSIMDSNLGTVLQFYFSALNCNQGLNLKR